MKRSSIARRGNGVLWAGIAHRGHQARSTSRRKARRALRRELDELWRSQAAGRHARRRRSRGARRPLRERRVHLRQEAARGDRSPRALSAQAADGNSRRRSAAERHEQGVLRRLVRARRRRRPSAPSTGSSGPTRSTSRRDYISVDSPLGRAVLGKALGARDRRAARPKASGVTSSSADCATANVSPQAKKSPAEAGRITGGNRSGLLQTSPIDQAHLTGTQIEIAREQRFDFFRLVALIRRLVHFHHSAEFLIRAGRRLTRQNEVRVVLNTHGSGV